MCSLPRTGCSHAGGLCAPCCKGTNEFHVHEGPRRIVPSGTAVAIAYGILGQIMRGRALPPATRFTLRHTFLLCRLVPRRSLPLSNGHNLVSCMDTGE